MNPRAPIDSFFGTHFGTYAVTRDAHGRPVLGPFPGDPAPSPLGQGFLDMADHPLRIRQPMVRESFLAQGHRAGGAGRGAEPFVAVDWETALDRVDGELQRVIAAHGNRAIFGGSYGWASAGRFHHAQSQLKRFLNLQGGFVGSVNTYSWGAAAVLLPHVLGEPYGVVGRSASTWDRIAEHTEVLFAFGGIRLSNAQVESGGCGRHRVGQWLERASRRGMQLIVLSPLASDVPAGCNARHVPLRPCTDTAVMLGMAHELLSTGRADLAFLQRCTHGHAAWCAHVLGRDDGQPKDPAWAEVISGVPAATIRELAGLLAGRRSLVNLSWSLQRVEHGEQAFWAAVALAALAGQVGQPGGGFSFGLGAVNSVGQPIRRLDGPALPQGNNPVRDFIPVARVADMLLQPGAGMDYDGQRLTLPHIRLVYWCGGNPFHHHQDLNRLRQALRRPQAVIVHESHWTGMARHADIVLPVTLASERTDITASARDNWMVWSRALQAPPPQARDDHEIFCALARRRGLEAAFTEGRDAAGWLAHLYAGYRARHPELPAFEDFVARGWCALDPEAEPPQAAAPQDLLADFVADPQAHPLATPSGRIELSSEALGGLGPADGPGMASWQAPTEWLGAPEARRHPLHLISHQPAHRLHGQFHHARASRQARVAGREAVRLNPADATRRGIAAGDTVRVFNDRGACLAGAVLDEGVMPGVAVLPTGAGYRPLDPVADQPLELNGNPNVLTADTGTSLLSRGPAVNCLVEVERHGGPVPDVPEVPHIISPREALP